MLLSKYVLTHKAFNEELFPVTWETSTIREWLNSTFITKTFSETDQKFIVETTVSGESYATQDRVFLLSYDEAEGLLSDKRATYSSGTSTGWLLRSQVNGSKFCDCFDDFGSLYALGLSGVTRIRGIRPALWIDISDNE